MFKIFKTSTKIVAPISGKCIRLEETKEPVFSSKMMGDGFAVIPNSEILVSPIDGEVIMLPDSKHAIGIKSRSDIEVLLHIGINTVELHGKGFSALIKQGSKVKPGTPLIQFDSRFMIENQFDLTVFVIFTNGYTINHLIKCLGREVTAGDILIS